MPTGCSTLTMKCQVVSLQYVKKVIPLGGLFKLSGIGSSS